MKKITYTITRERLGNGYCIAIREKTSGALNVKYPIRQESGGEWESVSCAMLVHVQELVNVYGAKIEWKLF